MPVSLTVSYILVLKKVAVLSCLVRNIKVRLCYLLLPIIGNLLLLLLLPII